MVQDSHKEWERERETGIKKNLYVFILMKVKKKNSQDFENNSNKYFARKKESET